MVKKMNIDIRLNIKEKLKDETKESLMETLDEAVAKKEEITLPGLGVIFEVIWQNISLEEKEKLAKIFIEKKGTIN